MEKILIIYNPYSGKGRNNRKIKKGIEKIALEYGYNVKFVKTRCKNDATDIVYNEKNNYELVLSMGGDGTFHELVRGNIKRDNPFVLGHLPVGTTNDLKKSFSLPNNTLNAFRSILSGKVVSYDVMTVNDVPFTYTAGFGKLLNIPYETKKIAKKKFGYLAYLSDGITDLFTRPTKLYDITYELDNKKYNDNASIFLVSNSNRMGGLSIYNDTLFNDSKFEVLIGKTNSIIKLAIGILQIQIFKKSKYYKLIKTDRIKVAIKDDDYKDWCVDGERLDKRSKKYDIKILKKINCKVSKTAKNYL